MAAGHRFRFGPRLGRGAFGEVYQAEMSTAGGVRRTVAVKLLRAPAGAGAAATALARFRDEARILGALHHRAIVQVHDMVHLAGQVALVTEYVPGADLSCIVEEDGPLPPRVALAVVGEVASALHAASSLVPPGARVPLRLVHRDIKPGNLRITPSGEVKLLDFGIARTEEMEREAQTSTGIVVGTVGYFSPERLSEEDLSPADDVYALGCVLFEALAGEQLYRDLKRSDVFRVAREPGRHGAFVDTRTATLAARPEPLAAPVLELLRRMLATTAAERPTAERVEDSCVALAAALDGPDLRQWARSRRWSRPRPNGGGYEGHVLDAASPAGVVGPGGISPMAEAAAPTVALPLPAPRPPAGPPVSSGGGGRGGLVVGALVLALGIGVGLRGPELWAALTGSPGAEDPLAENLGAGDDGAAGPAHAQLDRAAAAPSDGSAEPPTGAAGDRAESGPPVDPRGAPAETAAPPEEAEDASEPPVPRMGPPTRAAPAPLPAMVHGRHLLSLRPGGRLELRQIDSAQALQRPARRLQAPAGRVVDLCTDGAVVALAGPVDVELRELEDDRFVDRLRPARPRVDRVLCPGEGAVVAVALGSAGVATWWDAQGRELGRLQPPEGIAAVAADGGELVVLDQVGGVRRWDGRRRLPASETGQTGAPSGLALTLGGPPWALFPDRACLFGGRCVEALAARGLAAGGEGWLGVAGPDRIQLLDGVDGRLIQELPARPTGVFAPVSGGLLVVEPDGVRVLDPVGGRELRALRW